MSIYRYIKNQFLRLTFLGRAEAGASAGALGIAFAKVILGTLAHGPTLDVLVFGGCYEKVKNLQASSSLTGKVVALTNPNLAKSKTISKRTTVASSNVS
jgi:hypothetical protein